MQALARVTRYLWALPTIVIGPARSLVAQRPSHRTKAMDAYIARALKDWGVVGMSVAVVDNDSIVYIRGFGVRELDKPAPVDEQTVFAIGSNTKLFTAVATGMLVDAGMMRWDDRVIAHLPAFQLYDPWVTHEVTIRDLLSHRTGLGEQAGNLLAYGSGLSRAEILRRMQFLPAVTSFRSGFAYQNLGVLAAGEAAAAAAGTTWDSLITGRILAPLGLDRSGTSIRQLGHMQNVATPHTSQASGVMTIPWRDIDNLGPAGSIYSTAEDMARWLRFLLAKGRHNGSQLLRPETLREIESPQAVVSCPADSLRPSVHFCAYGLGVLMNDYRGLKVLSHTGGIDGMLSSVTLVPERRLGIVVLTNTDGHNALFVAVARYLLDTFLGSPPRDWSAILLADARQREDALSQYAHAVASTRVRASGTVNVSSYVGTYTNALYGDAVVATKGGALILQLRGSRVGVLEPWAIEAYRVIWRDAGDDAELPDTFIAFRRNALGAIESLVIRDDVTRPPGMGAWNADAFRRVEVPKGEAPN
jgi:CubicO group peptidase (beta-lactamase class C family)